MNSEIILLSILIFLFVNNCYLRYSLLNIKEVLNKTSDVLESVTARLRQTTNAYTALVSKVLPKDEKLQRVYKEYLEALNDYDNETEPANMDIRFHHYKVTAERLEKACEEYDRLNTK